MITWPEKASCAGTTLVELLVVVLVIAVLSSAAISMLSKGQAQMAAEQAAEKIAADIAFARADAMANRAVRILIFDTGGESYALHDSNGILTHPIAKNPFNVDLANIYRSTGIDMILADFGGSNTLNFGSDGVPTSGGRVEINAADNTWVVTVAGTGHILVSE